MSAVIGIILASLFVIGYTLDLSEVAVWEDSYAIPYIVSQPEEKVFDVESFVSIEGEVYATFDGGNTVRLTNVDGIEGKFYDNLYLVLSKPEDYEVVCKTVPYGLLGNDVDGTLLTEIIWIFEK